MEHDNMEIEKYYLTADDVAKMLNVSQSKAYQIIRILNKQLEEQGKITIRGRVNRKYFEKQMIDF